MRELKEGLLFLMGCVAGGLLCVLVLQLLFDDLAVAEPVPEEQQWRRVDIVVTCYSGGAEVWSDMVSKAERTPAGTWHIVFGPKIRTYPAELETNMECAVARSYFQ